MISNDFNLLLCATNKRINSFLFSFRKNHKKSHNLLDTESHNLLMFGFNLQIEKVLKTLPDT